MSTRSAQATRFRIASLIGCAVTYTPDHCSTHHGVILKATYSTLGEPVLVIRRDDDPVALVASDLLIGPSAASVIAGMFADRAA